MSLNKRLIILLLPIVIFGYGCATFFVYQYQKMNIVELEQAKLEQRMLQLQGTFNEEAAVADNLMGLFLEGRYLASFLSNDPSNYRDAALSQSLNQMTNQFLINRSSRLSFAIYSGDRQPLFYYERSTDPFASISSAQQNLSLEMMDNRIMSKRKLVIDESGARFMSGRLLDKVAFLPFRGRNIISSVNVSVSVQLDQFSALLRHIEESYLTTAHWSNETHSVNGFSHSIEVFPEYYLTITPDETVLSSPLFSFLINLIVTALVLGSTTYGLLLFLISRYITSPITKLDAELTEVMFFQKDNISPTLSRSEVGQLSKKFHDLFEKLQANLKHTHEMAVTDTLTSLPNRIRFHEYAKHILIKAERNNEFVSMIYIDLDNFKFVNDTYGHEAGDELLCSLAKDLNGLILQIQESGGSCMVSRLSGDEFAIVLQHHTAEEVDVLAQSVVELFSTGYHSDNYHFPVSASMGIASYPEDGPTLNELIASADMAMYHAKRSGKNRFEHYSVSIAAEARRMKSIENHLKVVDCDNEFTLVYMPYTGVDDQVKGFEVLIRWHSPELGNVDPEEFIPIAEQTGTYAKIDKWVFETAFKKLPEIRAIFGDDCTLSVNISAAELGHIMALEHLVALKKQYGIANGSVEIELTETFAYAESDVVFDVLNGLQEAGFSIVIDDFGAGYTPLLHMIDYPVSKVKLDKVLTTRMTGPEYSKLLKPLIELCHLQGIVVTAEGVENQAQQQFLKEAGCDFFQGYWLSKPIPFEELDAWFTQYQTLTFYQDLN